MKNDKSFEYVKGSIRARRGRRKNTSKAAYCVEQIARAYVNAKRLLNESERGHYYFPGYVINDSEKIVYHIDAVIDRMDEVSKFILENEIKFSKTGNWYRNHCSQTTYYRIRMDIYIDFIEKLNNWTAYC